MFKKIFHPMQNQDPTLYEKSWGAFRFGRYSAVIVLVAGSILAWAISHWAGNALQALFVFFPDFWRIGFDGTLHMFNSVLFTPAAFFTDEPIVSHIPIVIMIFHWISFLVMEGYIIYYAYSIWAKSRNLNHGEYGKSRIATPKEVKWETYKVPDRTIPYKHHSGFPVMHKFNWRGRLNKGAKTQIPKLEDVLKVKNAELLKMSGFAGISVAIFGAILAWLIGMGAWDVRAHGVDATPFFLKLFYYPFHIALGLALWIVSGFFRLIWALVEAQYYVWSEPISVACMFYFVELIVLVWCATYIPDMKRAARESAFHSIYNSLFIKDPNLKNGHNKETTHFWNRFYQAFIKGTQQHKENMKARRRNLQKVANDKDANSTHHQDKVGVGDEAQMQKQQRKAEREHNIDAVSAFTHHPFLCTRLAWWITVSLLVDLDDGITGWYYLSPRPHNVLIYGTSGSGKGQMVVNPVMDINSRTQHKYQPNMIVTDPKGESAASAYAMLKRRGYDVKVMNILDLSHSMSFNPLRLVIKNTRLGAIGTAAQNCSELSATVYDASGQGQNSYFYKSAASLFDAMTFALLALAHSRYYGMDKMVTCKVDGNTYAVHDDGTGDPNSNLRDSNHDHVSKGRDGHYHSNVDYFSKVTMNNILQMIGQLGGEYGQEAGQQEPVQRLFIYFDHLRQAWEKLRKQRSLSRNDFSDVLNDHMMILNQALQKFQQTKMAGGKTASSIFSTFLERLRIYQQPDVAKMTSMDNFNPAEMGFDRLLTVQFNRRFRLQNITARSWSAKPKYDTTNHEFTTDVNGNQPLEENKSHLSEIGVADIPFEDPIPTNDFYVTVDLYDERVHHTYHFTLKCHKKYYNVQSYLRYKNDYHLAPMVADMKICAVYVKHDNVPKIKSNGKVDVCHIADKMKPAERQAFKNKLISYEKQFKVNDKMRKDIRHFRKFIRNCYKVLAVHPQLRQIKQARKRAERRIRNDKTKIKDIHPKVMLMAIDKYTGKEVLQKVSVNVADEPKKAEYEALIKKMSQKFNNDTMKHIIAQLRFLASHTRAAFVEKQAHFLYNPRPTAWFVVAPQNKQELNTLGTFAIDQTFNILSGISMEFTNTRHVQRPLQMILDELGNLPAIPHLDRKASFGRSQHIYIMPIFQDREQADKIYKKDTTDVVFANCPTTVYILSNSDATLKQISASFEKRTVTSTSLSHNPTKALSVDYNSNPMGQDVMPTAKLRDLQIGEECVLRTTDRTDIIGRSVKPRNIFDHDNYIMPYSWWFLGKSFSHGSLGSVPIVTPHKYLDLNSLTIPFTDIYMYLEINRHNIDTQFFQKYSQQVDGIIHDSKLGKGFTNVFNAQYNHAQVQNKQGNVKKACHTLMNIKTEIQQYRPVAHLYAAQRVGDFEVAVLRGRDTNLDAMQYEKAPLNVVALQNVLSQVEVIVGSTKPNATHKQMLQGVENVMQDMHYHPDSTFVARVGSTAALHEEQVVRYVGVFAESLNNIMNYYLCQIGLLKPFRNRYMLSNEARNIINDPRMVSWVFQKYVFNTGILKIPLSKFVIAMVKSFDVPGALSRYSGLLLLLTIFTSHMQDDFNIGADGHDIDLHPNYYFGTILGLLDIVAGADKDKSLATNSVSAPHLSKYYGRVMKGLSVAQKNMRKPN